MNAPQKLSDDSKSIVLKKLQDEGHQHKVAALQRLHKGLAFGVGGVAAITVGLMSHGTTAGVSTVVAIVSGLVSGNQFRLAAHELAAKERLESAYSAAQKVPEHEWSRLEKQLSGNGDMARVTNWSQRVKDRISDARER